MFGTAVLLDLRGTAFPCPTAHFPRMDRSSSRLDLCVSKSQTSSSTLFSHDFVLLLGSRHIRAVTGQLFWVLDHFLAVKKFSEPCSRNPKNFLGKVLPNLAKMTQSAMCVGQREGRQWVQFYCSVVEINRISPNMKMCIVKLRIGSWRRGW